jgi:iron complex transport system substrate-binding protein
MTRWFNAFGVLLAVALAMLATVFPRRAEQALPRAEVLSLRSQRTTLPSGRPGLFDFGGVPIEIKPYARIASGSTVSDSLLLELVSPSRIASFTTYSSHSALTGHRFTDKPQVDALANLEGVLALKPDLLLVSTLSSTDHIARLRDAGLNVFSLGEMRGVDSFMANAELLSVLLDCEEMGRQYVKTFRQRLASVAQSRIGHPKKSAIYMIFYGGKIFGSGTGTSYHDVMTTAGLHDLGAEHFTGWPDWTTEQVLTLNPDVIVTRTGLASVICETPSLHGLRVCTGHGKIAEVPEELLNDPGPGMLPAAEEVFAQVYGSEPQ